MERYTSEVGEWHRYEDTITTPCLRDREMKTPGTQMMSIWIGLIMHIKNIFELIKKAPSLGFER